HRVRQNGARAAAQHRSRAAAAGEARVLDAVGGRRSRTSDSAETARAGAQVAGHRQAAKAPAGRADTLRARALAPRAQSRGAELVRTDVRALAPIPPTVLLHAGRDRARPRGRGPHVLGDGRRAMDTGTQATRVTAAGRRPAPARRPPAWGGVASDFGSRAR